MTAKNKLVFIITATFLFLLFSGCAQLKEPGPVDPDVSMFELYVSDAASTRLDQKVLSPDDNVMFTLEYMEAENFRPFMVSNVEYDFSRLKPVDMDVHMGFSVDDLVFLDTDGNPVNEVMLSPGQSVVLRTVIPSDQEKWDAILAESGSNRSVKFELVLKIKGLAIPIDSNEFEVVV